MEHNPDFEKLGAQFAELKQHGYELQANGVNLVKFAEAGSSNVAVYSSLYSASIPLAKQDHDFHRKLTSFIESGLYATQTLAKTNESLRQMHVDIGTLIIQPLTGVTFSNIAAREVVEHAVTIAPDDQKKVFADLSEKRLSVPFSTEELDVLLSSLGEDFPTRRAGAWDAFHSVSADAQAQASHSMRDILAKIIASLASNATIEQCDWYAARKAKDPSIKPSVSDRIRFLLFGPTTPAVDEAVLRMAARTVSEYVNDDGTLKSVAHGSQSYTRQQIKLSLEKIEELLYLVLRRLRERQGG